MFLVFVGFFLAGARPALAEDAGDSDSGMSDASALTDGGCEESGTCGAPEASPEASVVIACDGALCDTLQGRPSCDVAAGSAGSSAFDGAWLGGAALALGVFAVRRVKRGASRPGFGGGAC
jgi:hypothetical protein